jgi:transposase-like protein
MNATGTTKGDRCNPAAGVIAKFGGVRALARELGVDPATLSKWQRVKEGCGGLIPARYHWTLLTLARAKKIALSADDIIGKPGR